LSNPCGFELGFLLYCCKWDAMVVIMLHTASAQTVSRLASKHLSLLQVFLQAVTHAAAAVSLFPESCFGGIERPE
jgi:hypothetical protein